MPLGLLLTLVIGGIAGITLLLHLTGYSAGLRFDEARARSAWARFDPSVPVLAVHLSSDARAALIETAHGAGVIWAMGADSTGHWLSGADLRDSPVGLHIALHDFAAPTLHVTLTPEKRRQWRRLIDPTPTEALP